MLLREPKEKDAQGMLSWMHDPASREIFANDFASFTLEKVLNFICHANDDEHNKNFVCVDDNDNYLGTISLKNIDKNNLPCIAHLIINKSYHKMCDR